MDNAEKFYNLRYCVSMEGDGVGTIFTSAEKEELIEFLDDIEERWDMFDE